MRIDRRKQQRQGPRPPEGPFVSHRWWHRLHLLVAQILPIHKSAEDHAWIQRIWCDVSVFIAGFQGPPVMEIQRAILAAARRSRWTAILLRSVHPVWKLIVGYDVIKLPSRLVEPGTPRLAAVVRHNGALVAAQDHTLRIVLINPQLVIIGARRVALEHAEALSSIHRPVNGSVRHVDYVRILWINGNFVEVPASAPNAMVLGNLLPVLSAVIRAVQPAFFGVHDEKNPLRIGGRKGNSHPPEASFRRQSLYRLDRKSTR